jgi:hypothetical protein
MALNYGKFFESEKYILKREIQAQHEPEIAEKFKLTLIDKYFLRIKITVYWLLNSLSRFNDPAKLQGFRTQGGYIRHILPLLLDCCSIWFAEMQKEINCF